jgi:hypothetical protein
MGLSTLRALVVAQNIRTFGVPATVTRPAPDDAPIEASGAIWVTPVTEEQPSGVTFGRRERRRVLSLLTSEVPTIPRGTVIEAPDERDGTTQRWIVQAVDVIEAEHTRVVVVPALDEF